MIPVAPVTPPPPLRQGGGVIPSAAKLLISLVMVEIIASMIKE
jgi:hypothetical protein